MLSKKNITLPQVETELKKRLEYPYKWGRYQNNFYNGMTRFIYNLFSFDNLINHIENEFKNTKNPMIKYDDIFNYAINRWFNFWSAEALVEIICQHPNVKPEIDEKNRLTVFYIDNISFDHKTSIFPNGYPGDVNTAKDNPGDLITWLYENQSQEQRKHLKNRLFVILYSPDQEHWRLKAEISWLKSIVDEYINNFDKENLYKFSLEPDSVTLSDVIWAVKE